MPELWIILQNFMFNSVSCACVEAGHKFTALTNRQLILKVSFVWAVLHWQNIGAFLPAKFHLTAHSSWKLHQSATISSSCHGSQQQKIANKVCASTSTQSRREITLIWGKTTEMSTVCCFGRAGALVYVVRPKSLSASSASPNCVTSHHCCGRIF